MLLSTRSTATRCTTPCRTMDAAFTTHAPPRSTSARWERARHGLRFSAARTVYQPRRRPPLSETARAPACVRMRRCITHALQRLRRAPVFLERLSAQSAPRETPCGGLSIDESSARVSPPSSALVQTTFCVRLGAFQTVFGVRLASRASVLITLTRTTYGDTARSFTCGTLNRHLTSINHENHDRCHVLSPTARSSSGVGQLLTRPCRA